MFLKAMREGIVQDSNPTGGFVEGTQVSRHAAPEREWDWSPMDRSLGMSEWRLIDRAGDTIDLGDRIARRVVCEQATSDRDHPAVIYQEAVKFSPAPNTQYQPAMILLVRLRRLGRTWEMRVLDQTRVRAMTAKAKKAKR